MPPPQAITTSPAPPMTPEAQAAVDAITKIAARSAMAWVSWPMAGRGVAPLGYSKGMAVVFARVYRKLKVDDAAAIEMAKADGRNADRDALAHYASEFAARGMRNDESGADTLRHLFVLLIGLGIAESSGRYCQGFDRSVSKIDSEAADAGLFGTTLNIILSADALLLDLFNYYSAYPSGFQEVFSEGVSCGADDWQNIGTGPGLKFQQLSKECPAFAVEFAGVGLRNLRKHWGPINRKEVPLRPECDDMLRQVQRYVDTRGDIGVL